MKTALELQQENDKLRAEIQQKDTQLKQNEFLIYNHKFKP